MPDVIDVFPGVRRGWGWNEHIEHDRIGGTDVAVSGGTAVRAPASGRATRTRYISGTDRRRHSQVSIRLADGRRIVVMELADAAAGSWDVRQGTIIGTASATLWPHFHGLLSNGARVPIETFYTRTQPAAGAPAPLPDPGDDDMAQQGAFHRINTGEGTGQIWWQEKPKTPLIPVDLAEWQGYAAAGARYADHPAAVVQQMMRAYGTAPKPS